MQSRDASLTTLDDGERWHSLERVLDHLLRHDLADAPVRIAEIIRAINVLEPKPLIGRLSGGGRELVIGRDARGYLALYGYLVELDAVLVLALRSQTEARFAREAPGGASKNG